MVNDCASPRRFRSLRSFKSAQLSFSAAIEVFSWSFPLRPIQNKNTEFRVLVISASVEKGGMMESDRLIAHLIERLNDRDPVTRRNAAGSLRLHGHRAANAVPALSRLLEDPDVAVQIEVRHALDRLQRAVA